MKDIVYKLAGMHVNKNVLTIVLGAALRIVAMDVLMDANNHVQENLVIKKIADHIVRVIVFQVV